VQDPIPDTPAPAQADPEAQAQAAESAAVRRRWVTLAEVLGVLAVVIPGLALWNSWTERSDTKAEQVADAQRASARAGTLVLVAADAGKHVLALKTASGAQSVQSQKILFPTALGAAPAETTGEPRIEAGWFEHPLEKAREAAGLPDNSRGDERLPVVIVTRFLVDGEPHEDVAIYDIGFTISGRLLGGHSVALRGISLVSRTKTASAQAQLDARWKQLIPAK
jgi:hypothetical protein